MSSAYSQSIQEKMQIGVCRQIGEAIDTYIERRVEGAKHKHWGNLRKGERGAPCAAPATLSLKCYANKAGTVREKRRREAGGVPAPPAGFTALAATQAEQPASAH